jgi:hypothetical protein
MCSNFVAEGFCSGESFDPCTQEQIDLNKCLADNKCIQDSEIPDSCCQENCESEYSKGRKCLCSVIEKTIGSCWYDSYCGGGFPVWAIIVIIVGAIAVILAVVVVVIFYMRHKRRRQYESI